MSKETSQPKAVNIIRPNSGSNNNNNILYNSLSHSSSGSTTSNSSRRTGSLLSASSTNSARKPRVAGTSIVKSSMEKPILNLYHPPSRKPSYDNSTIINNNNNSKRPTIELYKPPSQQKMTKSFTAPSLTLPNDSKIHTSNNNIHYNRPISPSYIRPQPSQQQAQQYHRSVLGVINTPVAAVSPATATIQTSPSDIVNKSTSSPLIIDNYQKPEELNPTNSKHLDQERNALAHEFVLEDENAENDETIKSENDSEYNDDEDEGEGEEEEEEEEEDEEEPVINEARVNRKIADLELSINSLLTVNAMLEATVRKQALQLSQIKKQKSSSDGGAAHIDFLLDPHHQHQHQEEATDQTDQEDDEDDWENDALFQKLRKVTEHMIEQGQKSIDFEYKILGRVLSNYNAMDEDAEDEDEDEDGESVEEQTETASDQDTTHNDIVAEQDRTNSNADVKAPPPLFRHNTFESNNHTSRKATSSIPRNVSKFTRKKATPKSQNIHIST